MDRRGFLKMSGVAAAGFTLPGLLTACGGGSSAGGSSGGSFNGNLRVSMPSDVKSLDPQKQGDIPSMGVASNLFDTLTTRDADNKLVGSLATAWTAVDPTTWRFTIRQGVKFHDGEPCDAAAVAFSINRLINPATKSPIVELHYVKSAKVVDANTVDFLMSAPDPIIPRRSRCSVVSSFRRSTWPRRATPASRRVRSGPGPSRSSPANRTTRWSWLPTPTTGGPRPRSRC